MNTETETGFGEERVAAAMLPATSTGISTLSFADVERELPAGVKLEREDGVTSLTVWIKGFAPGITLAVAAPGAAAYVAAAVQSPWIMQIVLGSLAVSAYAFIGYVLGRRRVTLDIDALRVRSVPLPLPGDCTVQVDNLRALQVVPIGKSVHGVVSWRIDAVENSGKTRHLVQDLRTEQQAMVLARYLAQEHKLPEPQRVG